MKIVVIIEEQKLEFENGGRKRLYPVSTSKYGEGYKEGSMKTPLGKFEICEKIGDKEPMGMIFKDRQPTGIISDMDSSEKDCITSRILRLKGLQKRNSNTTERYIYIHGTADENSVGKKASMGCLRMKNSDIIELFRLVKEGCPVEIRKRALKS